VTPFQLACQIVQLRTMCLASWNGEFPIGGDSP